MTSLMEAAALGGQSEYRPHILICTPTHSGKVDINFHVSSLLMGKFLTNNGINYTLDFNVGMNIDWARSQMASAFLNDKQYTHLLFIDDDMAFAEDLPYRMLIENLPVVAVPYRRKQRDILYNIRHGVRVKTMPDDMNKPYLIAVESIATGMMLIRRDVIEKLAETTPDFLYSDKGDKGKLFFRHQLVDDEMVGGVSYMGEDYYFCKTVRDAGFDVWAYVDENIAHIGQYAFDGRYSDYAEKGASKSFSNDRPRSSMRILTK